MKKIVLIGILISNVIFARVGIEPPSERYTAVTKQEMELVELKAVDVQDSLTKFQPKDFEAKPLKFAIPNNLVITPKTHGKWTNVPGGKIWNLRFSSKNATDINFGFSKFHLPEGAELYFLSFADDPVYYDGPYTSMDNQSYKQFWSAPLPGGDVALELFIPNDLEEKFVLELTKVSTGFRDVFKRYNGDGLIPKSGSCNNDVVCPEGDLWRDDIRAVAAYTMSGTDTCTGTMVMDADRSFTPYFLTAAHCGVTSGNAASMVTIWNYESANCGDQGGGSRMDTVSGSIFKARRTNVDVGLVELSSTPPEAYNVFWAGWDNSGATPAGSVGIHHPSVDEKAISFNTDALTTINSCISSGGVNSHWEVDDWEDGTTEPGSSGSGLWDPTSHRLVGFLSGGIASCSTIGYDCYGKVSVAWDDGTSGAAGNLKPWLDPSDTGITSLAGSDPNPFVVTADDNTIQVCSGDMGAGTTINVLTNGVYTLGVTLSATTTPAFLSNISFGNSTIDPTPGTSTLTFDVGAGGMAGSNVLTIQAEGPTPMVRGTDIIDTVDLNLVYSADIAAAVTLTAPADAGTNVPAQPSFTWDADPNAISYLIEVSTDELFMNVVASETVTTTSYSPATDLQTSTDHYWRVTSQSPCGDAVSGTFMFTTTVAPGDCPIGTDQVDLHAFDFEGPQYAADAIYVHGFESNSFSPTWTVAAASGLDNWSIQAVGDGGSNAWQADDLDEVNDTSLLTPVMTLSSGNGPLTLRFWNTQSMEDSSTGCFDGLQLLISVEGAPFVQVTDSDIINNLYDGPISESFSNPAAGEQAWCGDPMTETVFNINVDAYQGQDVQFAFRVASDISLGRPEGWVVDNVRVTGCEAP